MPDEPRQDLYRVGLDDQLFMIGSIALRHQTGKAGLVIFLGGKADREGLDPAAARTRHHCDDSRGINSTREKRSERHIRNQTQAYSFLEPLDQLAPQLLRAAMSAGVGRGQPPVLDEFGIANSIS